MTYPKYIDIVVDEEDILRGDHTVDSCPVALALIAALPGVVSVTVMESGAWAEFSDHTLVMRPTKKFSTFIATFDSDGGREKVRPQGMRLRVAYVTDLWEMVIR